MTDVLTALVWAVGALVVLVGGTLALVAVLGVGEWLVAGLSGVARGIVSLKRRV